MILANVADLTRPTVTAAGAVSESGRRAGGVSRAEYQCRFYNDVLVKERRILPAELGPAKGDAGQGERFETLQSEHFEHPITSYGMKRGGNLAAAHFFRMFDLKPHRCGGKWCSCCRCTACRAGGDCGAIMPVAGVAIAEHTWGAGRVVLFGSTANTQWNDLPVRAPVLFLSCIGCWILCCRGRMSI